MSMQDYSRNASNEMLSPPLSFFRQGRQIKRNAIAQQSITVRLQSNRRARRQHCGVSRSIEERGPAIHAEEGALKRSAKKRGVINAP
jgi:hypothetical protein